jgi:hypothetical protein
MMWGTICVSQEVGTRVRKREKMKRRKGEGRKENGKWEKVT